MKLDNETQRRTLLSLLASSTVPGQAIDDAYRLKKSLEEAELEEEVQLEPSTTD